MSVRKRSWTTAKGEVKEKWVVDYVDGQGKRRLKTFAKKREADQFGAKSTVEITDGTHVADAASVTVAEAGRLWIETIELDGREQTTVAQYRQHAGLHIEPLIGKVKLTMLTAPKVRAFEDDLAKQGRSPAMVKKVMVSLGSLLADSLERGLVGRNVVREMKRRRGKADHRAEQRAKGKLQMGVDIPLPGEIRAVVSKLDGVRLRALLLSLIFAGLRASEIRGLRWPNVDLTGARVHIRERADRFKKIGKPKSAAGERSVPLPQIVVNALREWKMASAPEGSGLVFPAGDGGPLAHRTIDDAWMAAQVRAGVTIAGPDEKGAPIVRAKYTGLHSLRHFYASWSINRRRDGGLELPAKTVQDRLGHSSIKLTLDTYGHLFPSDDDGEELAAATAFLAG